MSSLEKIDRFQGRWRPLSNFWRERNGRTNENYFQAAKTQDPDARRIILNEHEPKEAKRLASKVGMLELSSRLRREIRLRDDWDDICDDVMMWSLRRKFEDPELREILLSTGDAELVEGNTWHDNRWGVCFCSSCPGQGENRLGRALMALRDELRHAAAEAAG